MAIGASGDGWLARPRGERRGAVVQLRLIAVLGLLALGAAAANAAGNASTAAGSQPTVAAHWVKKKLNFTYLGFTTHYSCQGLRDEVRKVLLELGARRSDLRVHEIGCTRSIGQPEPAPSVAGTFSVLVPGAGGAQHPVSAAWQRVNVRVGRPGLDESGQCELIEQVKQKILPLFSTRNVAFRQNCIPYQLTPNGSSLSVEVLKGAHAE